MEGDRMEVNQGIGGHADVFDADEEVSDIAAYQGELRPSEINLANHPNITEHTKVCILLHNRMIKHLAANEDDEVNHIGNILILRPTLPLVLRVRVLLIMSCAADTPHDSIRVANIALDILNRLEPRPQGIHRAAIRLIEVFKDEIEEEHQEKLKAGKGVEEARAALENLSMATPAPANDDTVQSRTAAARSQCTAAEAGGASHGPRPVGQVSALTQISSPTDRGDVENAMKGDAREDE